MARVKYVGVLEVHRRCRLNTGFAKVGHLLLNLNIEILINSCAKTNICTSKSASSQRCAVND